MQEASIDPTIIPIPESGIGLYPPFYFGSISRGQTVSFDVTLLNGEAVDMNFYTKTGTFTQDPGTLLNRVSEIGTYDEWVKPVSGKIPANSSIAVTVEIKIPEGKEVKSGSVYPVVIFSFSGSSGSGGDTELKYEHAVPLYLELKGSANPDAEIESFHTRFLTFDENPDFGLSVKSTGDTYVRPIGYIEYRRIPILRDGPKTRLDTLPVNLRRLALLPGSVLEEMKVWEQRRLGHYEAVLHVQVEDEEVDTETIEFWVVPWWYIIAAVTLIVVLISGLVWMIFRKKKRGRKRDLSFVQRLRVWFDSRIRRRRKPWSVRLLL